jgi:hypothetical protein
MYPSIISDRSIENSVIGNTFASMFGGIYHSGAYTGVYAGLHNRQSPFSERCDFCFKNAVLRDPVVQITAALMISSIPFPKSLARKLPFTLDKSGLSAVTATNLTSVLSVTNQILVHKFPKVKTVLKTDNVLFKELTKTTAIGRGIGRVALPISATFFISYSTARMFRCIIQEWDNPGEQNEIHK